MAPLFRLLRSLQFRITSSLESVDGLLGCSVAMPKNLSDLIDDFPGLDREEQILILDSLFYCINWFRELINAFSLIRDPELQMKVSKLCLLIQLLMIAFRISILLNILFHALMGRFQLQLFIFITYFSRVVPLTSCVFFPVGLLLLMRHFQQVL